MARNKYYCQCLLERPVDNKKDYKQEMITWIPSSIAILGEAIRIKELQSDKEWSEGWVVVKVWSKQKGDLVEQREADYKHQRDVSDLYRNRKKKK